MESLYDPIAGFAAMPAFCARPRAHAETPIRIAPSPRRSGLCADYRFARSTSAFHFKNRIAVTAEPMAENPGAE
jgi:hypothetical protein